jgi:hypothetical protein
VDQDDSFSEEVRVMADIKVEKGQYVEEFWATGATQELTPMAIPDGTVAIYCDGEDYLFMPDKRGRVKVLFPDGVRLVAVYWPQK